LADGGWGFHPGPDRRLEATSSFSGSKAMAALIFEPPDTFASWPAFSGWVRGVVLSVAPMDLLEKARLHLLTAIIAFY
jgi:hypothetical protein